MEGITNPALDSSLQAKVDNPTAFFNQLLPNAVTLLFVIASVIFLFMMVAGAIQWMTSSGDKQGLESARGRLSNAIVGLFILFALFAIITVLENFFGVDILTLDISGLTIR